MNATWPEGWRKTLTQKIAARGVRVILGDRIDHIEPRNGIVTTAAGERIPADLVVRYYSCPLSNSQKGANTHLGAHSWPSPEYQVHCRISRRRDFEQQWFCQGSALATARWSPKHLRRR